MIFQATDGDGKSSEPLSDEVGVKNAKDEEVEGVANIVSNSNPSITSLVVYTLLPFVIVILDKKDR